MSEPVIIGSALGVFAVALLTIAELGRRGRSRQCVTGPGGGRPDDPEPRSANQPARFRPPSSGTAALAAQRSELVAACQAVYELVTSDAVRRKLQNALAQVEAPTSGTAPMAEGMPGDADTLAIHRSSLVDACIEVVDLVNTDEVRRRLCEALAAVGVEPVVPDGEMFDPEHHEAMLNQPTTDPDLYDRIESTVYPGYRDGARAIRDPRVVVYVPEAVSG